MQYFTITHSASVGKSNFLTRKHFKRERESQCKDRREKVDDALNSTSTYSSYKCSSTIAPTNTFTVLLQKMGAAPKSSIYFWKASAGKVKNLVTAKRIGLSCIKRFTKCYVWSVVLCGLETWIVKKEGKVVFNFVLFLQSHQKSVSEKKNIHFYRVHSGTQSNFCY